jgi:hypothetical protein
MLLNNGKRPVMALCPRRGKSRAVATPSEASQASGDVVRATNAGRERKVVRHMPNPFRDRLSVRTTFKEESRKCPGIPT